MPLYEYHCNKCNVITEELQNINDSAPTCKKCGNILKKIISISSFVFKGDGWSSDGYHKKKKPTKKKG